MICNAGTFTGLNQHNKQWKNWNGSVQFSAAEYWAPGGPGLMDLVHVVARATAEKKGLHAIGSGWAFEDAAKSDSWVVSLNAESRILEDVIGGATTALTAEWKASQNDPSPNARKLVHVEAGIEIGALSALLQARGLAMRTLGGSNGQSLAGAISTSTHGGDWNEPPFPDFVRAIHLVTEGGREIWIERASAPITTDALLRPRIACAGAEIVRSDQVFDAALVSCGRFGVFYSLVLEVRPAFRVVEVLANPTRTAVLQALRSGMGAPEPFAPLFALLRQSPLPVLPIPELTSIAPAAPSFFQVLFSSLEPEDLWVTRRWETNQSADLEMQGSSTPSFLGGLVTIGLLGLFADPVIGTHAVPPLLKAALGAQFKAARRGPHHLVTSGTPEGSHNQPAISDSIEVIFDAADSRYIDFLNTIQQSGRNLKQAGYISLRPSRASRASLSMHNVVGTHALSIEVATLQGLWDNAAWMNEVEKQALAFGGRPHWGQINRLDEKQVAALYGEDLTSWRTALHRVSGLSPTFSNHFTRQRGMEPMKPARKVAVVSQNTDELLVFGIKDAGVQDGVAQFTRWAPNSPWGGWQPLAPVSTSPDSYIGTVAEGGRGLMFVIGVDGWVYHRSRLANGTLSGWGVVGKSNEPASSGFPGRAVNAVSCQPGMVHVFYTDRQGRILVARGDTANSTTWPESGRVRDGRTVRGGHVTGVSRRPGQLDIFTVGTDGRVYTAAWNQASGWQGWWAVRDLKARPGSHVAAVSRRMDFIDIFVADENGRTMSAAWAPGGDWKGWWHIQQGMTVPGGYVTGASRSADKLDIFTAGTDQRVYTAGWSPSGGWVGWTPIANATAQSLISVATRSPDKLDIFFVALDGSVQTAAWDPAHAWGGPWAIG